MSTFLSFESSICKVFKHAYGIKMLEGKWMIRVQKSPIDIPRWIIQVDNGYDYPVDEGSDLIELVFRAGVGVEYEHYEEAVKQIRVVLDRITY